MRLRRRGTINARVSQVHTQLLTDDASGVLVERMFRLRVVSGPD
ncbi:MAG: hypothetical protein H6Q90_4930, partial [Deltaproteobacteria bacterium]|nr:hypothetical protein [Deltaproteobacteria bacterium]